MINKLLNILHTPLTEYHLCCTGPWLVFVNKICSRLGALSGLRISMNSHVVDNKLN